MFRDIFGEGPQTKIFDLLACDPNCYYSISEIAKQSEVSRPAVYKIKDILLKKDLIIQTKDQGKSSLYKLNIDNKLVQMILKFDFEIEKEILDIELPIDKSNQEFSKNKVAVSYLRLR